MRAASGRIILLAMPCRLVDPSVSAEREIRDDKLSAIAFGMLDRVAHAGHLFDRRRRLLEHLVFPSSAPNVFSPNSTRDWLPFFARENSLPSSQVVLHT